eukprot:gene36270-48842_t
MSDGRPTDSASLAHRRALFAKPYARAEKCTPHPLGAATAPHKSLDCLLHSPVTRGVPVKATLQDVATRARVHRTTVSLALRDHPRIPAETRERVKAIAAKLGYRINPLVSALMQSRRSGQAVKHVSLAYVTNYPTRFGWRRPHHDRPDYFPGAVERARDFGYKLEHFWL